MTDINDLQLYMNYALHSEVLRLIRVAPALMRTSSTTMSVAQYAVLHGRMDILEYMGNRTPACLIITGCLRLPAIVMAAQQDRYDLVDYIYSKTKTYIISRTPISKNNPRHVYQGHLPLIEMIVRREEEKSVDVQPTLNFYLDAYLNLSDAQEIDQRIFKQLFVLGASLERYFQERPRLCSKRRTYIQTFMQLRDEYFGESDERAAAWCYESMALVAPSSLTSEGGVPYLHGLVDDCDV